MNTKKVAIILSSCIAIASAGYIYFYFNHCRFNQIKKIDSFTQAADIFKAADKNTLLLFDVDETLIIPTSVTMRTKTKEENQQWLKETIESIFTSSLPHQEDYYFDYWAVAEVPLLIEPAIVTIITSLQDRGVKVLALTNLATGSRGQITSLPAWRFNKLQQVDIDFSKANIPDTTFTQLPAKNGTHPVLYRGILATNHASKGAVLKAFLDYINWKPSHVVFFDDSLKRINEVAQEMCTLNIPFTGYHYQGSEHVPGTLDKEVATLQFKYLIEHARWLSDDKARALLHKDAKLPLSNVHA